MPKNPMYLDRIVLKNGGVIETEAGTDIVSVTSSGTPAVNAPISTTNATLTGNTTLGDASADTLTVNATSTFSAPVSVGVNDTGYDVQLFGATSGKSFLWDESADKMIVTGDASVSGTMTVIAGGKIASSVANIVADFRPAVAQDNIAAGAGGAVALTTYYTTINTDAGGDAFTLADSTVTGQLKKVQLIVDGGGDGVLSFNAANTITFADAGDFAVLQWNGADWIAIELGNAVDGITAPVFA